MKKKFLSFIIISAISLNISSMTVGAKQVKEIKPPKDKESVSVLKTDLEKTKNIKSNNKEGDDVTKVVKSALKEEGNLGDFKVDNKETDVKGKKHLRSQMFIDGIPVYGSQVIIHTNKDGQVYSVNGKVDKQPKAQSFKNRVKIKDDKAIKIAENSLGKEIKKNKNYHSESKLYLYKVNGDLQPVYLVKISSTEPEASFWHMFVSAENGKIVDKYNALSCQATHAQVRGVNSSGEHKILNGMFENGRYFLADSTRPSNGYILTYDANNQEYGFPGSLFSNLTGIFDSDRQKAGVDAHHNLTQVYDYYKNVLNRDSFDGKGASIISSVHVGNNLNNAFWNGRQILFGDGDGVTFSNLAKCLEVTAHEFTHAVTQSTAGLEYRFQSGALNEAFSDILGIAVHSDPNDWEIGEDIYTPNVAGDALRSMSNPRLYRQPDHMKDYLYWDYSMDKGGVHYNSGIPNKAAYLMGKEVGKDSMAKIYYHALVNYLTPQSTFEDARNAVVSSAIDLHGENSKEHKLAIKSWADVGVGEEAVR
ncbi:M4 family metallopeptidase [Hathewaya histolytica]|uniref:M4 family metallopeptidase n=1 Tax=Hathewaya histolytica TaxID=1498 RepID=UPI003B6832F9